MSIVNFWSTKGHAHKNKWALKIKIYPFLRHFVINSYYQTNYAISTNYGLNISSRIIFIWRGTITVVIEEVPVQPTDRIFLRIYYVRAVGQGDSNGVQTGFVFNRSVPTDEPFRQEVSTSGPLTCRTTNDTSAPRSRTLHLLSVGSRPHTITLPSANRSSSTRADKTKDRNARARLSARFHYARTKTDRYFTTIPACTQ